MTQAFELWERRRMKTYDPERARQLLAQETGVSMLLGKVFSEARAEGNLTGWAISCFREVVECSAMRARRRGR